MYHPCVQTKTKKDEITFIKLARKQSYDLHPYLLNFNPLSSLQCHLCSHFDIHKFLLSSEQITFLQVSSTRSVQCQNLPKALCCVVSQFGAFSWFVHPSRLSKDLPFIVKGIWTVKMSAPENVLEKDIAVQTHFCGSFMNHGTSGCL